MHKSGGAAGECSLAAPLAVRVGAARCCLLRALRDGRAVGGDVLIGAVFVDADGEVDIHEFVDAVEIASREGKFFGGIGSAHHTAGEPSGLHGVVDARLAAYGMERQVLVGLVGSLEDSSPLWISAMARSTPKSKVRTVTTPPFAAAMQD